MGSISFKSINKKYEDKFHAVKDFNLEVADGEFVVFVGPSGCGKSTTLRMLAGLEEITEGEIWIEDRKVNNVEPKNRDISMVFQNYALYPHMNAYDNMAFSLKLRKTSKKEIDQKVMEAANILGITELLKKKPKAMSGGQRQRIALGRSIVRNPAVFLMDEPLSNLDAKLRVQMRSELTKLHKNLNATVVYVTHDQTEAMTMASRIVVLNAGEIQQVGTPRDIYENPNNRFVAEFIGSPAMNIARVTLEGNTIVWEDFRIEIPAGRLGKIKDYNKDEILIGIRPEDMHDEPVFSENTTNNKIKLKVEAVELLGSETIIFGDIKGQEIKVKLDSRFEYETGDVIELAMDQNKISFFDIDTEEAL
ncbi:ABC transporter ATP-binding protein [Salinicoccus hispanicus]|uniref:sn-glycerol-3-phosphate ABC transporter ATP-binding protein UgpC n=1 Tax=Salinicoccus hispanicus TaxID=157225 RepID=A0A6N8TZP0_9STAP|nr:sn-glycerol-3-phosphate ABC transporter ATP-binding protein UgpC [Salinicoccus hispanicus]MXQ51023.1 sn-glycerol-3-phosphate ABC transporter ATP-binding protein UgpC [Salinicoccus hispanicus]